MKDLNYTSVNIKTKMKSKRTDLGFKSLEELELEKLNKSVEKAKKYKNPNVNKPKDYENGNMNIKASDSNNKCVNVSVNKDKTVRKKINLRPIKTFDKTNMLGATQQKFTKRNNSVNFEIHSNLLNHFNNIRPPKYKNNSMYNIIKVIFS